MSAVIQPISIFLPVWTVGALVIFVLTLVCLSRRGWRLVGVVLGLVLLIPAIMAGLYLLRQASSRTAQPLREQAAVRPAFEPSAEQLRMATVYPTEQVAARNLAERVAASMRTLGQDPGDPQRITLVASPADLQPVVLSGIRSVIPNARYTASFDVATDAIEPGEVQVRVERIAARGTGRSPGGAVRISARGTRSSVDESAQYVEAPWAADGAVETHNAVVGRSYAPCTGAREALEQAQEQAMRQVEPLLRNRLAPGGNRWPATDGAWLSERIATAIRQGQMQQESFVQELELPYGHVYRAVVRVPVGAAGLDALARDVSAQRQVIADRTRSAAVSIAALAMLIFLVYLFLNTMTRGYFTVRLRLAASGLLIAAVALIILMG